MHKEIENLVNKANENILSHAFLFETNSINKCVTDVEKLIKNIVCTDFFNDNCNKECNLCALIECKSLPSVNYVLPDGTSIKKQQIIDLKERLQTKPVYTEYNFYIIINADKMNLSSANTILKFLEEPSDNIVGFYITENIENIIPTIKSRCQITKIIYENSNENILETDNKQIITLLGNFIDVLEKQKENFLNNDDILYLKERVNLEIIFKLLIEIYENHLFFVINKKNSNDVKIFDIILSNNSFKRIIKKLSLIKNYLDNLQYNPNIELLIDSFIIEMGDLDA